MRTVSFVEIHNHLTVGTCGRVDNHVRHNMYHVMKPRRPAINSPQS